MKPFHPDVEFTKGYFEFMNGFGMLTRFRKISEMALPKSVEDYADYFKNIMLSISRESEEEIFPESVLKEPEISKTSAIVAQSSVADTLNIVDSISLVFAHALLEAYLMHLIYISKNMNFREFCLKLGNEKKVTVQELAAYASDDIFINIADKIIDEVKMKSLIKKTKVLYTICAPPDKFISMRDYRYDEERLTSIDENRQKILHEPKLILSHLNIEEDLYYIEKTALHFFVMIHHKFGLVMRFDPNTKQPITDYPKIAQPDDNG
jgi:hypothetical protein